MCTWTYQQSTGRLYGPAGHFVARGYSGHGLGVNNPALEADPGVGPIPAGLWTIGPPKTPPDHLGPCALPLTPDGFDPHGRTDFFMHGDFAGDTGELASRGCIVIGPEARLSVLASTIRQLKVIP